jgi:DNA repair exonuclease SbcCD ATPase subunit
MAHKYDSKKSKKDASDSDSKDEVCDELSSLHKENEELVDLLDDHDHMLREAKKFRKDLRALLEESREKKADLESKNLDARQEIESLKAAPVVSGEIDYGDCVVFLYDLILLKEKHASKLKELDVLRVELDELKSRSALLGACTTCPSLHEKLDESHAPIVSLEAALKPPIANACFTCEVHTLENLELAQRVDRVMICTS